MGSEATSAGYTAQEHLGDLEQVTNLVDDTDELASSSRDVFADIAGQPGEENHSRTGLMVVIGVVVVMLAGAGWLVFRGGQTPAPVAQAPTPAEIAPAPDMTEATPEPEVPVEAALPEQPAVAQPEVTISTVQDTLSSGGKGPLMMSLPGGEFAMGSPSISTRFDERPQHQVTLQPFAMSKYEVSIADYKRYLRATGKDSDSVKGDDKLPVTGVSWEQATAYADWLSQQTGKTYRLPTEAEWEYAARANADGFYWWGNDLGSGNANCFGCGSQYDSVGPAPVDSFQPSPFGLHNTAGNVMEWTRDCYHKNYEGAPTDGGAWTEPGCNQRVVRGGAFNTPGSSLQSTRRKGIDAKAHQENIGIRLVRENS
jgi:formylglycine-generating enzyme required for sulfatase activity